MVLRASSANPQVLRWARERAGLSVAAAAAAIGRDPGAIEAWESGAEYPTYRQLTDLAQRVYKRPVAVFFFPAPPNEPNIPSRFRTLPDTERDELLPDTLFALREARAWQLTAGALFAGLEESFRGRPDAIRTTPGETVRHLTSRIREILGITPEVQRRWRSYDEALKAWRAAVETIGILVFKRPFKQESISGFCLDDATHPVIVLNNSTSHSRQIFTLAHEIAHLAFGLSGVTTREETDLGSLGPVARDLEIRCNQFAAELLVPPNSIDLDALVGRHIEARVTAAAQSFRVSREVILRRLLDAQKIDRRTYARLTAEWREDYFRSESRGGGGSYYANVGTYLSDAYARAALYQYHAGRLGVGDLAEHLRIKAKSVEKFEAHLLSLGRAE